MSTVANDLLTECVRLGITLEAHGDKLRCHPRRAMTADLAERLKAHKAELLIILTGGPEPTETHGQREVRRFLSVCVPHPNGGAYDPKYADVIKKLACVPIRKVALQASNV